MADNSLAQLQSYSEAALDAVTAKAGPTRRAPAGKSRHNQNDRRRLPVRSGMGTRRPARRAVCRPKDLCARASPAVYQAGWGQPDRPPRATRPTPDGSHRRHMAPRRIRTRNSHRNVGSMQAQIARQLLIAGKDGGWTILVGGENSGDRRAERHIVLVVVSRETKQRPREDQERYDQHDGETDGSEPAWCGSVGLAGGINLRTNVDWQDEEERQQPTGPDVAGSTKKNQRDHKRPPRSRRGARSAESTGSAPP